MKVNTAQPSKRSSSEAIQRSSAKLKDLPERLAVFGISALPPFHMQVLAAISRYIEVNLFLMNPCREYWADIVSGREMKRFTGREKRKKPCRRSSTLKKGIACWPRWGRWAGISLI